MKFVGIIPARYASSRFPGKALFVIEGKTMIQRVYEQAKKSSVLSELYVATDDISIETHVKNFGGNVVMTSKKHLCGTDRCHEAFNIINKEKKYSSGDVVINIQGDEPLINPKQIELVCSCFGKAKVNIATLIRKIDSYDDLMNPGVMKVVTDKSNKALYFSRAVIPFLRGVQQSEWMNHHDFFMHIGLYAYKASTLNEIVELPQSALEKAESLEQLRWIENGYSIYVEHTEFASHSVDTPNDVKKIVELLKKQ
jgi:3-deoxy-manno-octulosonate cytidylyltransferase (CMP-KDO synthetase)